MCSQRVESCHRRSCAAACRQGYLVPEVASKCQHLHSRDGTKALSFLIMQAGCEKGRRHERAGARIIQKKVGAAELHSRKEEGADQPGPADPRAQQPRHATYLSSHAGQDRQARHLGQVEPRVHGSLKFELWQARPLPRQVISSVGPSPLRGLSGWNGETSSVYSVPRCGQLTP